MMTTQVYSSLSPSYGNSYFSGINDNTMPPSVSVADELLSSITMTTLGTAIMPTIISSDRSNTDTINLNPTSYGLDTNEMSATLVTITIMTYNTMFDLHYNSVSTSYCY